MQHFGADATRGAALRRADAALYVDTGEALQKSGDLLGPTARSVFTPAQVRGTLPRCAAARRRGASPPTSRTVSKSVGNALKDLAAMLVMLKEATLPAAVSAGAVRIQGDQAKLAELV